MRQISDLVRASMTFPKSESPAAIMHGDKDGDPPLDLAHLARQTAGDRALAQEVLWIFLQQVQSAKEDMPRADPAERRFLAHRIKGAARAVGAFAMADAAERLEAQPAVSALLAGIMHRIEEACHFIGSSGLIDEDRTAPR
jgi:HPt (histidine-containing phosphotransfer) domain-containing protein